ncbi:uncharacterized membrane protein YheB (UPF0754 family) [Thermostichus sp. MS-CIW-21]|jgi:uncharacterized membrane protein YheB (UPF0754 family)|uniref:UPF0754 membrane protein CYA_0973 n=1 Tax=Synechococcus sp. (strain JA-3-3Ab) TaxID=321327 RepID=Y973_SYNJA|nr:MULTISPECIES: DUF445 family protein [unclassified Synechococcus]Q2JVQ8.1 RecName: Full=UPF0754 membrane protein CYA_0973 [Synechococcus sp. JA-3-3Ab]ABC99173.1 conserved hypothetical protein [Synechococcus sp. JA-3-3Ab]PIK85468.1 membrane protein [Synechococcus sp. 63AY4M2]PIK88723.1 membrane protein [Synechococcus sp. 65AY6A5]PIK89897.1 membrane protein [Synechococcus sp. 65AY6Li]PIK94515.1 membrane protein [Synechococcus sp. 60AY4M2]
MALWIYVVPPLAGLVIGYFTNDIAIKMLFRPYRAYRIFGWRIPFTPGLIPQNQPRLAKQIAKTIMGSLLTPEELHNLARKLLRTERMQAGIRWLLGVALDRLQNPEQQQQTAQVLARILADLFNESLPRLVKVLARQETFLEGPINQLFDQVLLELRLNAEQARQLSEWILKQALPPKVLRQNLVDFLTDRNIEALDEEFRERATGSYWLVANLFGLKNALLRLRTYCLEEPEGAEAILEDLLKDINAPRRLTEILQNLSLQNLPVSAVRQLRRALRDGIQDYLRSQGPEVIKGLGESIDWEKVASLVLGRLRNSKALIASIDQISADLALILERYLERDLESLMMQVIPVLNLDQVIADKVNATSPAELEQAIQQIVRQELQAIVNLGGLLGFLVGCVQVLFLLR